MMTMTITTNTGSRARIWNPKVKSVQKGSTELCSSSCVAECHWCQFNFTSSWFHVTHSSSGASYTSVRSFSLRYAVTLWYSFVTPQVELAVSKMDANDKSWRECYAYSRHAGMRSNLPVKDQRTMIWPRRFLWGEHTVNPQVLYWLEKGNCLFYEVKLAKNTTRRPRLLPLWATSRWKYCS